RVRVERRFHSPHAGPVSPHAKAPGVASLTRATAARISVFRRCSRDLRLIYATPPAEPPTRTGVVVRGAFRRASMTSASAAIDPTNIKYDSALSLLRARLPECGESLHRFLMVLVFSTGEKTTASDAFAAWRVWLHQQRGVPAGELHPD